jgi:hypothetical protein
MNGDALLRKAGYRDWLVNRQYPLKPSTIKGYLSTLKLFPRQLDVDARLKQSVFNYLSASTLGRAIGELFSAPNYEAANSSAHGSFNTAIKYYERFLVEREQRKAMLLADASESEARFSEWLSRQMKNYSDAIVDAYVGVLEVLPPLLRIGGTVSGSLYSIGDPVSFYSIRERLKGAANYDAINSSNAYGFLHGALNASLKLYGLYLEYLSDSQIVTKAIKALTGGKSTSADTDIVTEVERTIIGRNGQSKFRQRLLASHCSCELCALPYTQLLVASHIKPWSISNNYERLDPDNGLVLCVTHDALFDKGLISFDYDHGGVMHISDVIRSADYDKLWVSPTMTLVTKGKRANYMDYHFQRYFAETRA